MQPFVRKTNCAMSNVKVADLRVFRGERGLGLGRVAYASWEVRLFTGCCYLMTEPNFFLLLLFCGFNWFCFSWLVSSFMECCYLMTDYYYYYYYYYYYGSANVWMPTVKNESFGCAANRNKPQHRLKFMVTITH